MSNLTKGVQIHPLLFDHHADIAETAPASVRGLLVGVSAPHAVIFNAHVVMCNAGLQLARNWEDVIGTAWQHWSSLCSHA